MQCAHRTLPARTQCVHTAGGLTCIIHAHDYDNTETRGTHATGTLRWAWHAHLLCMGGLRAAAASHRKTRKKTSQRNTLTYTHTCTWQVQCCKPTPAIAPEPGAPPLLSGTYMPMLLVFHSRVFQEMRGLLSAAGPSLMMHRSLTTATARTTAAAMHPQCPEPHGSRAGGASIHMAACLSKASPPPPPT